MENNPEGALGDTAPAPLMGTESATASPPPWEQPTVEAPEAPATPTATAAPQRTQAPAKPPPWETPTEGAEPEPAGWISKENIQNLRDIGSAGTNPALALGRGAVQYYRGQNTAPAAIYHGATSMIAGDLPERLRDAGRDALSNYFGIGSPTPKDQVQKDSELETQLLAQHPVATWGGRILGLFGLGATGAAGEGLVGGGIGGKIAYSGLIGAGSGALAGFGNGGTREERLQNAKTGAMVGGFLGIAGGALGGWLEGKQAATAATASKEHAAHNIGLNMAAPVSQQLPEYGAAASNIIPYTETSAADVAQSMKDKGIALLRQSGTKQAILSPDGVASIGTDIMKMAEAENIDIGRHFDLLSPSAKQAWSLVENLAQRAQAGAAGAIPWKDVANDALRMNNLYVQGDRDYRAIRSGFFKWIDNLSNAEMFSGDKTALEDFAKFRQLYKNAFTISDKTALGKIFDYAHGPQQVVNWLNAATKMGDHGPAVGLVTSLKGLLGDASDEWQALRSTAWNNIAAANETTTGVKLAQRIDALRQSPVAKEMFSPEQLQGMGGFSNVLKTLPNKAAPSKNIIGHALDLIKGHGAHGVTPALAGLAGAGHAAWHGVTSGHDPMEIAWDAIKEGALTAGSAAALGTMTGIPPAGARYAAPFAATKAVLPTPSEPAQINKRTGGKVQHDAGKNKFKHGSSPSLNRAMNIARHAKSR